MALYVNIPAVSGGGGALGIVTEAFERAQSLVGTTVDRQIWHDFEEVGAFTLTVGGVGTNLLSTTDNTTLISDSGANAGGSAVCRHSTGVVAPALVSNLRTARWYMMATVRFATAINANTDAYIGLTSAGGSVVLGVVGAASTANFYAQLSVGPTNVNLNTAIDTNWHVFEMWNDTTNIHFAIDGTEVATTASTNAPSARGRYEHAAANGATAASRTIEVDFFSVNYVGVA